MSHPETVAHPGHGPRQPAHGTPPRRPGSFRRTTTHASSRPDGILGDVHMEAIGRDLWTGPDGSTTVLAHGRLDAVIAFVRDRSLQALSVEPDPGLPLDELIGLRVSGGFRRALDLAWTEAGDPEERSGSLTYQLLDELPTAALVSGYALGAAGLHPPTGSIDLSRQADICAGWVTGGTMLVEADRLGHTPPMRGPLAPDLGSPDDAEAWHPVGPMGPHAMRRWRRMDVWREEPGGSVGVEAFFRDSHLDTEGVETVVHEYVVTAEMDPGTYVFRSCRAHAGALPWVECPGALASAGRVVGTTPHDLRERVRQEFTGTSTCTHLNDTLRSFAAVPHMAAVVERGGA